MMGTPAGAIGMRSKASAIAESATNLVFLSTSRGQTNPKNAAGTAASSP